MPATLRPMPARPAMLRAGVTVGRPVGVDADARVIRGYVTAQEGPFKTPGRGEFDRTSLRQIVAASNAHPKGLRVRFQHPSMSDDGLGKYLGRSRGAWLDTSGPVWRVRADLHFADSAADAPAGDLAGYVMRLAAEDPDALSSSLCVDGHEEELRLNKDGTPVRDDEGHVLPPLWRVKSLCGSDIVDTGDAVDGLLSVQHLSLDDLPDALQRRGWEMLDRLFQGATADVVRARCGAYVERYVAAHCLPPASAGGLAAAVSPPVGAPAPAPAAAARPVGAPAPRPNRERAGRILGRLGLTPGR